MLSHGLYMILRKNEGYLKVTPYIPIGRAIIDNNHGDFSTRRWNFLIKEDPTRKWVDTSLIAITSEMTVYDKGLRCSSLPLEYSSHPRILMHNLKYVFNNTRTKLLIYFLLN